MKIYIYARQKAHGIKVIVENLKEAFLRKGIDSEIIDTISERNKDDIIIPYGVKEANDIINSGNSCKIAFSADAITLGFQNKIKHYLRIGHVFNYDFIYSIYAYLRYSPLEKRMIRFFDKCIFVSPVDINYMISKTKENKEKFLYAQNGIYIPNEIQHNKFTKFRIGILSPWVSKQITEESRWFIVNYFKKYSKENENVELILAGRGPRIRQFEGLHNVKVIGEVDSLEDFFSNIDIMISSNPKGCGILNRVLDSFAYKVPVLGVPGSFTGFPNSDNCYYTFNNYTEFRSVLNKIIERKEELIEIANNAYVYITKNNNWNLIYDKLVDKIISNLN